MMRSMNCKDGLRNLRQIYATYTELSQLELIHLIGNRAQGYSELHWIPWFIVLRG